MHISFTALIIIGELMLAVGAVLIFALLVLLKKSRLKDELIDNLQDLLRKELIKNVANASKARKVNNNKLNASESSAEGDVSDEDTQFLRDQLALYEKRIDSLERFKQLFFDIEERLRSYSQSALKQIDFMQSALSKCDGDSTDIQSLTKATSEMREHILALSSKTKPRSYSPMSSGLSSKKQMERSGDEESDHGKNQSEQQSIPPDGELADEKGQLETMQVQSDRIKNLQARIKILEAREKNSDKMISDLKHQVKNLEQNKFGHLKAPELHPDRLAAYEELKKRIEEREELLKKAKQELTMLESEYENLFKNYELLMSKKEDGKEHDVDLILEGEEGEQEDSELEKLQQEIEKKKLELDRKDSECKLLEQNYLDLVKSNEELGSMMGDLERTKIEFKMLEEQLETPEEESDAQSDVEKKLDRLTKRYNELEKKYDEDIRELDRLRDKAKELERLQREYNMLEQQLLDSYEQKYSNT